MIITTITEVDLDDKYNDLMESTNERQDEYFELVDEIEIEALEAHEGFLEEDIGKVTNKFSEVDIVPKNLKF